MAVAPQGIDVRATGDRLVFRAFLQDSAGAIVTSGTTSLYLYELQDDGTLKSYDFNDNTFKTTALTTETASMTHRTGNNGTTNTGIWTYALTTVSGFTAGAVYLARVKNTGASPTDQVREWQYGKDLTPTGLDAISVADPGAPANMTSIPRMVVALWRWFYKKTTLSATELKTFADDGTTVNGTAAVSDTGALQTKGPLS